LLALAVENTYNSFQERHPRTTGEVTMEPAYGDVFDAVARAVDPADPAV
jgi:hypothetical protein